MFGDATERIPLPSGRRQRPLRVDRLPNRLSSCCDSVAVCFQGQRPMPSPFGSYSLPS